MQPGDLVIITRNSIGIPKGTLGLIIKIKMDSKKGVGLDGEETPGVHTLATAEVLPHGRKKTRRYLIQDLRLYKDGLS